MNADTAKSAYDAFSSDYDRFVNWDERLAAELPFLTNQLKQFDPGNGRAVSVLDAACGTGMHAIALARAGFTPAGADISPKMIQQAEVNARESGFSIPFKARGFGELADAFEQDFDALFCLGNSLPHLLSEEDIIQSLEDFAACLQPDGMLILQNRNFDAVMANKARWFPPQYHKEGSDEQLFIRLYDFDTDGLITFHIMRLKRAGSGAWEQEIDSVRLFPLTLEKIENMLSQAGFVDLHFFGALDDAPFDPDNSGNLVVAALKRANV